MRQDSAASSEGNVKKKAIFGIGRNRVVLLMASVLLFTAFAGLLPNGTQEHEAQSYETAMLSYPGFGPVYRIIDGTSSLKFTAEKDDGDGGWETIDKGTDVTMQNAINAISADAGNNDHSIIFWGDGTQEMNTLDAKTEKITFSGSPGVYRNITLYGSLTSTVAGTAAGTGAVVVKEGANVTSYADLDVKETAFNLSGGSTLDLLGGTVAGAYGVKTENSTVNVFGAAMKATIYLITGKGNMINIKGGTLEAERYGISNSNGGKVTISEDDPSVPTLIKRTGFDTLIFCSYMQEPDGGLEITGGTFIGTVSLQYSVGAIKGGTITGSVSSSHGKLTISEDDPSVPTLITSPEKTAVHVTTSEVEITGGTFRSGSNNCDFATVYMGNTTTMTITGAVIEGAHTAIYSYSSGIINIYDSIITAGHTAVCNHGGTTNIYGSTVYGEKYLFYTDTSKGSLTLGGPMALNGNIKVYLLNPPAAQVALLPDFEHGPELNILIEMEGNYHADYVAISGAAAFVDNFTIFKGNVSLYAEGNDLLYTTIRNIEVVGGNMTHDAPATVRDTRTLTITLTPDEGYGLPNSIKVMKGAATLAGNSYTYDKEAGTVTIPNITGNMTVTVTVFKANKINLDPNNGGDAWTMTVQTNTVAKKPADPEYYGWTFLGWFDGSGVLWTFAKAVTYDMTLRAKWAENPDERFTVTFDPNNGNPTWYVTVPKNTSVAEPKAEQTSYGWLFAGWSYGGTSWDFADPVNDNITLTAEWEENPDERFNVTFDPNNGTPEFAVSVIKGDPAERPDNPARYGWTFLGWYDGDAMWTFANIVTDNITLTARWAENPEDRWTVTFNPDNGDPKWIATVEKGYAVSDPGDPSRPGYTFLGWHLSETLWGFGNGVIDNMTLTALWEKNMEEKWTVTFDPDNGRDAWSVTVPRGTQVTEPRVAWYGWSLEGWYLGDTLWDFGDAVNDNITLTAKWAENPDERYTVTFDPNNGGRSWSVTVPKNAPVAMPPEMRILSFFGWFDAEAGVLWEFDRSVTDDMTLRAKWFDTDWLGDDEKEDDGKEDAGPGDDGKEEEAKEEKGGLATIFASLAMLVTLALILSALIGIRRN